MLSISKIIQEGFINNVKQIANKYAPHTAIGLGGTLAGIAMAHKMMHGDHDPEQHTNITKVTKIFNFTPGNKEDNTHNHLTNTFKPRNRYNFMNKHDLELPKSKIISTQTSKLVNNKSDF